MKCKYCYHNWQKHRHTINNDTWNPCTIDGCDCFTFQDEEIRK